MKRKTKADGYFIEVKNKKGYPSIYTALKVTNKDTSKSGFGGGNSTRLAVFKKYQTAYDFGRREVRRLNKKYAGDFGMIVQSINLLEDYKCH